MRDEVFFVNSNWRIEWIGNFKFQFPLLIAQHLWQTPQPCSHRDKGTSYPIHSFYPSKISSKSFSAWRDFFFPHWGKSNCRILRRLIRIPRLVIAAVTYSKKAQPYINEAFVQTNSTQTHKLCSLLNCIVCLPP